MVGSGGAGLSIRVCIALSVLLPVCAGAAESTTGYPSKPIHYIVPFAPGGPTDIMSRAIGEKVGAAWGQQVVVDNRSGAGGNRAAAPAGPGASSIMPSTRPSPNTSMRTPLLIASPRACSGAIQPGVPITVPARVPGGLPSAGVAGRSNEGVD